eukprot:4973458-Pyramimonas_sp.AAC.1
MSESLLLTLTGTLLGLLIHHTGNRHIIHDLTFDEVGLDADINVYPLYTPPNCVYAPSTPLQIVCIPPLYPSNRRATCPQTSLLLLISRATTGELNYLFSPTMFTDAGEVPKTSIIIIVRSAVYSRCRLSDAVYSRC